MSVREHDEQITTELQQLRKLSEKVKVSREVANFLQKCENSGDMNWEDAVLHEHIKIFENHHGNEVIEINPDAQCMLQYSPFELARILVLGYEIEQSPEELIYEYYQASTWVQEKDAVLFVLETLDIKIKGVND